MTVVQALSYAFSQRPSVRRRRVLVGTIPPYCAGRPASAPLGAPEALNQAILENAAALQYEVVDVYSALAMASSGEERHPVYCTSDGIHLTDAAKQVVGYMFANVILNPACAARTLG
jgi:hypothetical protein